MKGIDLRPDKYERGAPLFNVDKITRLAAMLMQQENYFTSERNRAMNKDLNSAVNMTDEAISAFKDRLNVLLDTEKSFAESSKRVGGQVRDSVTKLGDGLLKIEKSINFDRLERYVTLLERAEVALSSLADMDKAGRLDRIAAALK